MFKQMYSCTIVLCVGYTCIGMVMILYLHTNHLLNRYRQVLMGTPAATDHNIIPVPAITCSYDEEVMVVVTPRKDYYLTRRETVNFMSPIQETCQFTSAETVF